MQNAKAPGAIINPTVFILVPAPSKNEDLNTSPNPSTIAHRIASATAIIGVNQNTVAAGLSIPISFLLKRICVRAQRKPPNALALRTRSIPPRANWVSDATMSMTPDVMMKMTLMRRQLKRSSRKANAKRRTKMRAEDLHMAIIWD